MKLLDLFSGIGGFSLAAEWVWGKDLEIASFCEIDPFCQQVLKKHWPHVPICGDIRELNNEWITANADRNRLQIKRTQQQTNRGGQSDETHPSIDLLTGGFPCQPFSCAGQQRGKADDRYLWPEMLRVIREFKPRWVIGENVAGIINLALDEVCASLENEGYEVQPIIIPACDLNAPHRRDRVWIICHTRSTGLSGDARWRTGEESSNGYTRHPGNPLMYPQKHPIRTGFCPDEEAELRGKRPDNSDSPVDHPIEPRFQGFSGHVGSEVGREKSFGPDTSASWGRNWIEVATEFCGVDDGFPVELDGFKLSKSKHRENRIKALGNAIVPQIPAVLMQIIRVLDETGIY